MSNTSATEEAYAKPKAPGIAPRGTSGLEHYAGRINEEKNRRLRGRLANKVYREMLDNEATVGGAMRAGRELVCGVDWEMDAASTDPLAEKAADLAETALLDMDSNWVDFMTELFTATGFGHAYMNTIFKYRRGDHALKEFQSKHNDGAIGFRNIALRGQESLDRWELSRTGEILGMHQRDSVSNAIDFIPMHRAMLLRTESTKNNPEGRSWLRNAYRSWFFVKRFQELEAIGIDRDIAGYPDIQAPAHYFASDADPADKQALADIQKLGERIRQDKNACIVRPSELNEDGTPTGHKFSLISAGSRQPTAYDLIIKRYESRILITMMAEFVLLGLDKVGSFSMHSDKTHLFSVALGTFLRRIEDALNRVAIPRLLDFNGIPREAAPTFRFNDIERADALAFSQSIGGLISTGALTPDAALETHVREYLDLPQQEGISFGQLQDAAGAKLESEEGDDGLGTDDANERALDAADPKTAQMEMDLGVRSEPESDTVSVDEAAIKMGVTRSQIMRAIRNGKVPGFKVGNSYRIGKEDLKRFMAGGQGQ